MSPFKIADELLDDFALEEVRARLVAIEQRDRVAARDARTRPARGR